MIATDKKELTQSFNLYDVLPLEKSSSRKNKQDKADIFDFNEQLEAAKSLFALYEKNGLEDSFETDSKILEKLKENANLKRMEYFMRNHKLPSDMNEAVYGFKIPWVGYKQDDSPNVLDILTKPDSITRLGQTPTVKLGNVKKLADSLDMIIFPFDYIDDSSYKDEDYETRKSIQTFVGDLNSEFDLVVLAPINHYSLTNHAKSENPDKQIYAGKHSIIFTSVLMNIPMFRSIINDLTDLRDNVDSLSGTISNVEQNMQMMQNQLTSLQKQIDQQKEQMLQQQIQHTQEISSMSRKLSEMEFRVTDPVLFAIPKNTDINDMDNNSELGYVGPVWGPDFDGVALFQLDMEIIKNQRNILNDTIKKVW